MLSPRRLSAICLLALWATLPGLLRAERPFSLDTTPGKLPKTVVPRHYALHLQPDLEHRTFTGTARIEIEARQPVHELVMNALDLTIDSVALVDRPGAPQTLTSRVDPGQQTLTVPVALAAGPHTLLITYRGLIGTQAQGFFVDPYSTPQGRRVMLGTQMESTDARRVFPGWDEPVFRATYDITLVVPARLTAISNMPAVAEVPLAAGLKSVTFARTPAMASYLVAIYAAEFESVEDEYRGVKLRVLTTAGKRASARYALEAEKRILAYYEDYFGIAYPLPKLDLVGVPDAFSGFSAMENWGCITYIDTALLYDPAKDSQGGKERVFAVVAHEMAHQWFGNLVTMAWWNNIWLNEGFASWLGTRATAALNPTWEIWLRANGEKEASLGLDARASTHAVLQPIENEEQAANAFDSISYLKGQSLLRMFETFLGEKNFQKGIQLYIRRHAYGNTTTADLWAALDEASGQPVAIIAANWVDHPGFPLVTVAAQEQAGRHEIVLRQTRYTLDGSVKETPPWHIPLTYASTGSIAHPSTLVFDQATATLPWPAGAGPVKLNVGNTGFYRVQYDDILTAALQAQADRLPVADQLNLLSDTWALAQSGRSTAVRYLELAAGMGDNDHPVVVEQMLGCLGGLDALERAEPGRRAFQQWACNLLRPQLDRIGRDEKPGESPLVTSLRGSLIGSLGTYGDRETIVWAHAKFQAYLKDPASVSGNLVGPVFGIVGRYADRATYDQLHELARHALTTLEKRRAYGAMQSALDPALIQATIDLTLTDEMPVSESNRNLSRLAAQSEDPELVSRYAVAHFDELIKRVSNFERYRYLPDIMQPFLDSARADELMAVTKQKLPADALRVAARTAESIRSRDRFKHRSLPAVDAWVREQLKLLPE
ncbi:MAG: M1 family metallopeptidase [Opitutales bacterium]